MERVLRGGGVLLLFGLLAAPAVSDAQEFSRAVIDSFDAPGERPFGIEWVQDLGVMYVVDEWSSLVHSIEPDGTATLLFDIVDVMGFNPGAPAGNSICYVPATAGRDGTIFIGDTGGPGVPPYRDLVYEFTTDGTWLNTWDVETQCGSGYLSGITFDGSFFWLNCGYYIVKCDEDFNLIESFVNPAGPSTQGGLDYDADLNVMYIGHYDLGPGLGAEIYVVDLSDFSTVDVMGTRVRDMCGVSIGRPPGARDHTLWITSRETGRVYEIEDEYDTPVEGGSWSTVKALYR
ncbi:MAG: hypothetical protein JXB46_04575 [Candidatus Eisenbacteria bacterium]|nr:hypothetical protein [Candidatus Eisenbacteria bacterium]